MISGSGWWKTFLCWWQTEIFSSIDRDFLINLKITFINLELWISQKRRFHPETLSVNITIFFIISTSINLKSFMVGYYVTSICSFFTIFYLDHNLWYDCSRFLLVTCANLISYIRNIFIIVPYNEQKIISSHLHSSRAVYK